MHGSISKRVHTGSQYQSENSFADETPAQQDKHREIEQRYRQRKRRGATQLFPNLRKRELERLFADRWKSEILPDDDAGRHDLRLMADHLAQLGEHYVAGWARVWAPWLTDDQLDNLIEQVGPGKRWKASALGKELNLNDETRARLDIRTIAPVDRTKPQRAKRCKEQEAAAARSRRVKAGATPRATSAAQTKPWEAQGISRRTWYRNRRNGTVGTNSSDILLESRLPTNLCQGAPPPSRGGTLGARGASTVGRGQSHLYGESLSG